MGCRRQTRHALVWGTSYAGAHVLVVAATDRRVRAVVAQVPLTAGWSTFTRLVLSVMLPTVHREEGQNLCQLPAGQGHRWPR